MSTWAIAYAISLRVCVLFSLTLLGPTYSPLETVSESRCVVESRHPYEPGECRSWPVVIEGAGAVEVG